MNHRRLRPVVAGAVAICACTAFFLGAFTEDASGHGPLDNWWWKHHLHDRCPCHSLSGNWGYYPTTWRSAPWQVIEYGPEQVVPTPAMESIPTPAPLPEDSPTFLRQEAARREAARREAARQEAARREAAAREMARQEALRREADQQEAARQELARREAAQREAAVQEAARRQEVARQEAARQDAIRQAAMRQAAARQQAAALQDAALNNAPPLRNAPPQETQAPPALLVNPASYPTQRYTIAGVPQADGDQVLDDDGAVQTVSDSSPVQPVARREEPAYEVQPAAPSRNQQIATLLADRLRACPQLADTRIVVRFLNGAVQLEGNVRHRAQVVIAEQVVRYNSEVETVSNQLHVADTAMPPNGR